MVKLTAILQVQKVKGRTYNYLAGTKGQIGSIPGSNFTMKVIVQKFKGLIELVILALYIYTVAKITQTQRMFFLRLVHTYVHNKLCKGRCSH